ncbi:hypothetical protein VTO42DRAFT_3797 [Malbranchea cinnamomea]
MEPRAHYGIPGSTQQRPSGRPNASYPQFIQTRTSKRSVSGSCPKINLKTVDELRDKLKREPEVDLLAVFPKNYARRIKMATATSTAPSAEKDPAQQHSLPEFRTRLDSAESASVVFPLSQTVSSLLARGVVVKCNEEVVAKVIEGDTTDTTEYTTMQFLAENGLDIPVPRPHGLIRFGPFRVIFITYIPDTTLA